MELIVSDEPFRTAAQHLARRIRHAARRRGRADVAVSGGSSAPPLFSALLENELPWNRLTLWQVDERVAPDGHPDRNAEQLVALPCRTRLMPVTVRDLRAGARRYAAGLPDRFDVVHLGLGDDGHTASWPPGDPVVDSSRDVECVGVFNGCQRMTLTPRVVNGARARLLLTTGESKAEVVERWLLRDPDLPVQRVRRTGTVVVLDPDAASRLPL